MINQSLELIRSELNTFVKSEFSLTDDKVNISGLVKQDGKPDNDLEIDSISLMLVGLQEENAIQSTQNFVEREGIKYRIAPSIFLNLQILVLFNFTHYVESLKFLSAVIRFFQGKPFFDADNTTNFAIDGIDKLKIRHLSQTAEQQNHLWGSIGAKYMPSLLYKVNLLNIQDGKITEEVAAIKEIERSLVRT